ncbi:MAG: metallophosphoesterase [Clostridia bacterium]|nr:metallophosphoesterase [Clostridia bacterium]
MKIVVISDTHGDMSWWEGLKPVIMSADCLFHLGDGAREAEKIQELTGKPVYCVKGNCDIACGASSEEEVTLGGKRIFACHGNRYRVETDLYAISAAARSREADICLYGHTHVADITNYYGVWFVNPGSLSRPRGFDRRKTYAVLETDINGDLIPSIYTI